MPVVDITIPSYRENLAIGDPPEELKNQPRRCSGDDVCEKAELTREKCGKYIQRPGMNV